MWVDDPTLTAGGWDDNRPACPHCGCSCRVAGPSQANAGRPLTLPANAYPAPAAHGALVARLEAPKAPNNRHARRAAAKKRKSSKAARMKNR
jgi:hypothetical protein